MTTHDLQRHIIDLAFTGNSEAPFVSCYLPFHSVSSRRLKAGAAPAESAPQVREAFEAIGSYLAVGVAPGTRGAAIFARRGRQPFFLALPLMVAVPYSVSVGPLPELYPLVESLNRYEPFLLASFEDTRLRLLLLDLGKVAGEVLVEGPTQRHRKMIQHALSGMAVPRLVLAGTQSQIIGICAQCRPAVLSALVGTVSDGRRSRKETISAAIAAMGSYQEKVSHNVAEEIARSWEPFGSAAAGPVTTLEALASDTAETIWFSTGCRPEPALICAQCARVEWKLVRPVSCVHCGDRSWYETDSREQIVHAAVRNGCPIRILWNQNVFDSLGGVVCAKRTRRLQAHLVCRRSRMRVPRARPEVQPKSTRAVWFTRSAVAAG
jgi:hypothetical protein